MGEPMYVDAVLHGGAPVACYAWTPEAGGRLVVPGRFDVLDTAGLPRPLVCPDAVVGFVVGGRLTTVPRPTMLRRDIGLSDELDAHLRACDAVGLDPRTPGAIPDTVLMRHFDGRRSEVMGMPSDDPHGYFRDGYEFGQSSRADSFRPSPARIDGLLAEMTVRGIRVDTSGVTTVGIGHGDRRFLDDVVTHAVDGRVHPSYDVWGGRTGRIGIRHGSFNPMSIPRGNVRRAVVPSFAGGAVVSFDLNAVDYRCLVGLTGDHDFISMYRGRRDFHARTAELVFGKSPDADQRRIVKSLIYPWLYGSSDDAASSASGLSSQHVRRAFTMFDVALRPLVELRASTSRMLADDGSLTTPWRHVAVEGRPHAGMLVGLLAQTASAEVFRGMLHGATTSLICNDDGRGLRTPPVRSVPIFPVHDELVYDMHPDEISLVDRLARAAERGADRVIDVGFKVTVRGGPNYGEQETM